MITSRIEDKIYYLKGNLYPERSKTENLSLDIESISSNSTGLLSKSISRNTSVPGITSLLHSRDIYFRPKGFDLSIKVYPIKKDCIHRNFLSVFGHEKIQVNILQDDNKVEMVSFNIKDLSNSFFLLNHQLKEVKQKEGNIERLLEKQRKRIIFNIQTYRKNKIEHKLNKIFNTDLDFDNRKFVFNKKNKTETDLNVNDYKQLIYESMYHDVNTEREEDASLGLMTRIRQNDILIQKTLSGKKIYIKMQCDDSNLLGEGGRGVVYKLLELKKGKPVALKFPFNSSESFTNLSNEAAKLIELQGRTNHQGIQKLPTAICYQIVKDHQGSEKRRINGICSKLYDYNLHYGITKQRIHCVLPDKTLMDGCHQLLSGLLFLHTENMVHRDIKPMNVLIHYGKLVRFDLCDLGATKSSKELQKDRYFLMKGAFGDTMTPEYIPRSDERHIRQSYTDLLDVLESRNSSTEEEEVLFRKYFELLQKLDVYQLGVTLFYLLIGVEPFAVEELRPCNEEFSQVESLIKQRFSDVAKNNFLVFFNGILHPNPLERYSAMEAWMHWDEINLNRLAQEINEPV
jgi:hypothetical protein